MVVGTIETGVDKLINLLKNQSKISIAEAAKKLDISSKILQTWIDFLVEEKIISIEYKFTQPYIYLNKKEKQETKSVEKTSMRDIKEQFFTKAKAKKLTKDQTTKLWKEKLIAELEKQKEYFYTYAKAKKMTDIPTNWGNFCTRINGVS